MLDNCYSGAMAEAVKNRRSRVSYAVFASSHYNSFSTGNWTFTESLIYAFRGDVYADDNRDGKVTLAELETNSAADMLFAEEQVAEFAYTPNFNKNGVIAAAQNVLRLKAIGNGEKVRLAIGGKSKIVPLEGTDIGDFTAGGEPPHRYTTLLSVKKGNSFYLVAKFVSGATLTGSNAPCGGDQPETLLLIEADKNLNIDNMQTEIFASCIYNGAGRYVQGKMEITKSKVSVSFDEGSKKYKLIFDVNEAEKGLQLINR